MIRWWLCRWINSWSETEIEDWTLSFILGDTIGNIWGGQIISSKDGNYIIQNVGYNQNINPGEIISIGYTVSNKNGQKEPTDYEMKEVN